MIFTRAEIDVLRLSAWCKDLPKGNTKIIPPDIVKLLFELGLIRSSRCGLSYRTTPKGYELLQKGGYDYAPDKQYRGKGAVLTRRLETAEITGFFWRYGADVFLDAPDTEKCRLSFLPSFALRRKTYANVLGGTRLAGFLYAGQTAFVPYYISPESEGVYANVEHRTFRAESLLCGRTPVVLYTGDGTLEQLIHTVTLKRYKKKKSTTDTYLTAMEKFDCQAAIMPMNESGMRQLRILGVPDYKGKLLRQILGKDYLPPVQKQSDGHSRQTKEDFLIGIDCNITRFANAISRTDTKTHIILLSTQAAAIQNYLKGQNAVLHPIEEELAEQILGIPHEPPSLNLLPFQTGKGKYLYDTTFGHDKKAGRKGGKLLEKNKDKLPKIFGIGIAILYFYGMLVRSVTVGIQNVWQDHAEPLFTWSPFRNIGAVFTPAGLMITLFIVILYCLFTKKGYSLISGYKTVQDKERGIEILPEGTHGTSGWMTKKEISDILNTGNIDMMTETLFGKLPDGGYVGMKELPGMSRNIIVYGAPGTGKSRGFVMPFIMQAVKRNGGESLILVVQKRIVNPTAYLMSTLYNSICEKDSDLILSLPPEYLSNDDIYMPAQDFREEVTEDAPK